MIKKIISVLFAVIFVSCIGINTTASFVLPRSYDNGLSSTRTEYTFDTVGLKDYLTEQIKAREGQIDISSFRVSIEEISIYDFVNNIVVSFNISEMTAYYDANGYYLLLKCTYLYSAEKCAELEKQFNANVSYLLRDLNDNSLSEEVKALIVHDRLIAWTEYEDDPMDNSAYGPIVNRKGVCTGYSRAYKYLLEQLGMTCEYTKSQQLGHAWNIVTVNGKRYHVDTTWDDPLTSLPGTVLHTNFLRSSAGLKANNHNATDYDTTPSDTKYDNYYWQGCDIEIQLCNSSVYYIKDQGAKGTVIKRTGSKESTIITISDKWPSSGTSSYYVACYSTLCSDGNYVYFNTKNKVLAIDNNDIVQEVCTPSLPSGLYLYGVYMNNGLLKVRARSSPLSDAKTYEYTYDVSKILEPEIPVVTGVNPVTDTPAEEESFIVAMFKNIASFFRNLFGSISGLFN